MSKGPTVRRPGRLAAVCEAKAWVWVRALTLLLVDRDEVDRLRKRFMKLDRVWFFLSFGGFPVLTRVVLCRTTLEPSNATNS